MQPRGDATIKWCVVKDLFVLVHASVSPAPGSMEAVLEDILAHMRSPAGRGIDRALAWSPGPGLSPKVRSRLAAIADEMRGQGLDPRAAVLSDSSFSRGVTTALSWLGAPVRHFGSHDWATALRYLDRGPERAQEIRDCVDRIRIDLR